MGTPLLRDSEPLGCDDVTATPAPVIAESTVECPHSTGMAPSPTAGKPDYLQPQVDDPADVSLYDLAPLYLKPLVHVEVETRSDSDMSVTGTAGSSNDSIVSGVEPVAVGHTVGGDNSTPENDQSSHSDPGYYPIDHIEELTRKCQDITQRLRQRLEREEVRVAVKVLRRKRDHVIKFIGDYFEKVTYLVARIKPAVTYEQLNPRDREHLLDRMADWVEKLIGINTEYDRILHTMQEKQSYYLLPDLGEDSVQLKRYNRLFVALVHELVSLQELLLGPEFELDLDNHTVRLEILKALKESIASFRGLTHS